MKDRDERFLEKFDSAKNLLLASSVQDIASIKFRSNTTNTVYRELVFNYLQMELGLKVNPATGNYWGNGWLVEDAANNHVIIVEHESGLEILYIAGSIASLISLVPTIYSGWKFLKNGRNRFSNFEESHSRTEVRRIEDNSIVEQNVMSLESYVLIEYMKKIDSMQERISLLELEIERMNTKKKPSTERKQGKLKTSK